MTTELIHFSAPSSFRPVIYRKYMQWSICLSYGKMWLIEKNYEPPPSPPRLDPPLVAVLLKTVICRLQVSLTTSVRVINGGTSLLSSSLSGGMTPASSCLSTASIIRALPNSAYQNTTWLMLISDFLTTSARLSTSLHWLLVPEWRQFKIAMLTIGSPWHCATLPWVHTVVLPTSQVDARTNLLLPIILLYHTFKLSTISSWAFPVK